VPQIGSEVLVGIAKKVGLIVIDPFRYSHGADENDSTEMMGIMQQLRYCAVQGAAVVVLHHPAKREGSTGRGSSAIRGAADVALLQELDKERLPDHSARCEKQIRRARDSDDQGGFRRG